MSAGHSVAGERSAPAPQSAVPAPFAPAAVAANVVEMPRPFTEGALARQPEPEPVAQPEAAQGSASIDELRREVCSSLSEAGHQSASQLLASGLWTMDEAGLRIEVSGVGKKMLGLTVNAAAEKIMRQTLQRLGGPARFTLTLGEGAGASSGSAATLAPGGLRQAALDHPLVQRAQQIFQAEIRSVVDLSTKK